MIMEMAPCVLVRLTWGQWEKGKEEENEEEEQQKCPK